MSPINFQPPSWFTFSCSFVKQTASFISSNQSFKTVPRRDFKVLVPLIVVLFIGILPSLSKAQMSGNNLSATMGSSGGLSNLGGVSGVGSAFSSSNGSLLNNMINGADPLQLNQNLAANIQFKPLPPNEFQKYVLEVTGQNLPLFG